MGTAFGQSASAYSNQAPRPVTGAFNPGFHGAFNTGCHSFPFYRLESAKSLCVLVSRIIILLSLKQTEDSKA